MNILALVCKSQNALNCRYHTSKNVHLKRHNLSQIPSLICIPQTKESKRSAKKRTILYLLESFLTENGYKETADCLRAEAKLTDEYTVCDNINLETIVTEFEIFYHQRFKIHPQLCKRVDQTQNKNRKSSRLDSSVDRTNFEKITHKSCFKLKKNVDKNLSVIGNFHNKPDTVEKNENEDPLPELELKSNEWKEYRTLIMQNICCLNTHVKWDDVKGLDDVKQLLKEAIIYPIKYSGLFTGVVEPWRSILMYGPPGTGKTLLAQAVATESDAKFFNVSSSSIINKWRGDTEKLIRVLFELAHHHAPSIIFIDEIDSLTLKRNPYEHEASRRMKSEIFFGVDNLVRSRNNIFLLATTNTPWDLDEAMLRRFEKQVHIPVPDKETRKVLLQHFLPRIIHENPLVQNLMDYERASELTASFSGCDIKNMCKEIKMSFMREIFLDLESNSTKKGSNVKVKAITDKDIENTLDGFKSTAILAEEKYLHWETKSNYNALKNKQK